MESRKYKREAGGLNGAQEARMEPRRANSSPGGSNGAQEARMELRRPKRSAGGHNGAQEVQMEPFPSLSLSLSLSRFRVYYSARSEASLRRVLGKEATFEHSFAIREINTSAPSVQRRARVKAPMSPYGHLARDA